MKCCKKDSKKSTLAKVVPGRLCYCFEYSEEDVKISLEKGKQAELLDEIKSKMVKPGCFCESANPSGKCCLADINKFIEKNSN